MDLLEKMRTTPPTEKDLKYKAEQEARREHERKYREEQNRIARDRVKAERIENERRHKEFEACKASVTSRYGSKFSSKLDMIMMQSTKKQDYIDAVKFLKGMRACYDRIYGESYFDSRPSWRPVDWPTDHDIKSAEKRVERKEWESVQSMEKLLNEAIK